MSIQNESKASGILLVIRGITGSGKSTLGKSLERTAGWRFMEMDKFKTPPGGCTPEVDFPAFGRMVYEILQTGNNVAAEEAFLSKQHLDWFLKEIPGVHPRFIWLACSPDTSVKRKSELQRSIVEHQHRRLPSAYRIPGELVIDTNNVSEAEVFSRVLEFVRAA